MEEEEYLEIDPRRIILGNLRDLGVEAEFEFDKEEIEKQPYFSGFFSGSVFRMVDNLGTIRVKGLNFDYVHIVRRG
jgi:hypothetical protein